MQPALTVWYDGGCPLCVREIALFRALSPPGAIAFVDASNGETSCPLDRSELLARFHAQERNGPVVSGAAAFAAMWRATPLFWPMGIAARIPPVLMLLEAAYRAFLKVRPRLQAAVRRLGV